MNEFFKKIKASEAYEILKDQSAIIIFLCTLLGSFFLFLEKVFQYLFVLGRFGELNIPQDFNKGLSFSFYDIVLLLVSVLCFLGGFLIVVSFILIKRSALTQNKKLDIFAFGLLSVIHLIIFVILNISLVAIIYGDKTNGIIAFFLYASNEIVFAKNFIDKFYKIGSVGTAKEVLEKDKATEKEEQKSKKVKQSVLPLVVALSLFFLVLLGTSNYFAGKQSATDIEVDYQIIDVEDQMNLVVLEINGDNYIVAKCEGKNIKNKDVLIIYTNEQNVINIENCNYTLQKYDEIRLEDFK